MSRVRESEKKSRKTRLEKSGMEGRFWLIPTDPFGQELVEIWSRFLQEENFNVVTESRRALLKQL